MFRLASLIYTIASGTFAGIAIIVVLVMGYDTLQPILLAAAAGFVIALPISWVIAKKINELE